MPSTNVPDTSDESVPNVSRQRVADVRHSQPREPFAMAPRSILRDASISPLARLLYMILDDRAGASGSVRVSQATLAQDVGTSVRTIKRAIAELGTSGLIHTRVTGRSSYITLWNPSRTTAAQTVQDDLVGHQWPTRGDTSGPSTEKEGLRNKQATPAPVDELTVPDLLLPDPLEIESFLDALPAHLRPEPNSTVLKHLSAALDHGWTVLSLAAAIRKQITNPDARPGLTVRVLAQLSTQPATEHVDRPTPTPMTVAQLLNAARCDHGELIGRCALCRVEAAQTAATREAAAI